MPIAIPILLMFFIGFGGLLAVIILVADSDFRTAKRCGIPVAIPIALLGLAMVNASKQVKLDKVLYANIQNIKDDMTCVQIAYYDRNIINITTMFNGVFNADSYVLRIETFKQECGGWCFIKWPAPHRYSVVVRPKE